MARHFLRSIGIKTGNLSKKTEYTTFYGKTVPASVMRTYSQIAECSLFTVKILCTYGLLGIYGKMCLLEM